MTPTQDDLFLVGEADAWYRRNRKALECRDAVDWPCYLVERLADRGSVRSVGEFGCCTGFRLEMLKTLLPGATHFGGVDASAEAVAAGMEMYDGLDLRLGSLAAIPFDEPFDLVVVNFVLHWVDRATLSRSISEIDRLVTDGGFLVIGDFLPDYAQRRSYHHLPDEDVYTFKQDYGRTFEGLGIYRELARVTFNHDHAQSQLAYVPSDRRAFCGVLRKSLSDYYPVSQP